MTNDPIVQCKAGTFRGVSCDGLHVFAGIPYAAPPVDELRFRPPKVLEPFGPIISASRFPPAPMQKQGTAAHAAIESTTPRGGLTAMLDLPADISEDCLYLNIWSPGLAGLAPVVVWLYGGGFESGSASPPFTDGSVLANAMRAVVVAVNYRVGALGFLHLEGIGGAEWAGSTNLGLQDQAAALHWVRENIASFGGDPANVTLAGQSAGGFSIGALLGMPRAADTFHRAILDSGSVGRLFSLANADETATALLAKLGVGEIAELLDVAAERLVEAQQEVIATDVGQRFLPDGKAFGPVPDGDVVPVDPRVAIAEGSAITIPLLIGTNRDEVRIFQLKERATFAPVDRDALLSEIAAAGLEPLAAYEAYERQLPSGTDLAGIRSAFLGDMIYSKPADELARLQRRAGGKAFRYVFEGEPLGAVLGAFHGADILYIFDKLEAAQIDSAANRAIRDNLWDIWRGFVHGGEPPTAPGPGPQSVRWCC